MDGKLLLVTNADAITPVDIVARYEALADIERGFGLKATTAASPNSSGAGALGFR